MNCRLYRIIILCVLLSLLLTAPVAAASVPQVARLSLVTENAWDLDQDTIDMLDDMVADALHMPFGGLMGWVQDVDEHDLFAAYNAAVEMKRTTRDTPDYPAIVRMVADVTDADPPRESPSVRLTRAERGVVQHIARKYRVSASSVEQYMGYARQSGKTYNVDPYLIMAVMATESSFNPRAQSRVGAQGLMQVHTRMHKKRFKPYGSTDTVWEPKVNIQVGSSILSDYLKRYGGSERQALKAYVGAARMSHDGGYGNKVLRRRDEFVSVSVAAGNNATSQAMASQADGGRKSVDL